MMVKKQSKAEAIKERAIKHGMLFIKRNATIRSVAKETGHNKSTVHLDLYRLQEFHLELFQLVEKKINQNINVRAYNGGEARAKQIKERKKRNDSK